MLSVSDLAIFPIKSLPGVHVEQAVAGGRGLEHPRLPGVRDRAMMVVDSHGRFITSRTHAKALSKITVTLDESAGTLNLVARDVDVSDVLRIDVSGASIEDGVVGIHTEQSKVKVWEWEGPAAVVDRVWFSKVLDQEVTLVRCLEQMDRPVDPEYAPGEQTGFSDGFPYLFVFEESLCDLFADTHGESAALSMMGRFRGNIVVAGGEPWREDGLERLTCRASGVSFSLCKPCSRCTVPGIDPETGEADSRVIDLLRRRRSGGVLGWTEGPRGFKHATFFGVNAVLTRDDTGGVDGTAGGRPVVSVGDQLLVA